MALFVGSFTNKLDRKGRVSLPARFRAALEGHEAGGGATREICLMPHHRGERALIGFDEAYLHRVSRNIDRFNPFTHEGEEARLSILASIELLSIDGEGRIIIPAERLALIGAGERLTFLGAGETFQIRAPDDAKVRKHEADKAAPDYLARMGWAAAGARESGE